MQPLRRQVDEDPPMAAAESGDVALRHRRQQLLALGPAQVEHAAHIERSHRVELEGNVRLPSGFAVNAATGITSVHYTGSTTLHGNRVPQVPSYNVGAGLQYNRQGWTGSAQLRVTGPQFEDDLNVFTLRRATVVDLFGGRTLTRWINVFVAGENVFDSIYDVGRTPVLTTGLPRAVRAGIRIFLP